MPKLKLTDPNHNLGLNEILLQLELNNRPFQGHTAVITGGAQGIGEQTARGLALLGATVVIVDKLQSGSDVSEMINKQGGKAHFIQEDLSSQKGVESAIAKILILNMPIDFLINNHVHFEIVDFKDLSFLEWKIHFATNVDAVMLMIQEFLPFMLKRNRGAVINVLALEGMAHASAMSCSKVAMRSLLLSISGEMPSDSNVNILGFAPGLVDTPLVRRVFPQYAKKLGMSFSDYVFGRMHNQGFKGLMPAQYSAAGLLWSLAHASEFHGLIAEASRPLLKHGITNQEEIESIGAEKSGAKNASRLHDYIQEVVQLNLNIEKSVAIKTAELEKEKKASEDLNRRLEIKTRELELMTKEAQRASEYKSSFLATMSHEIRTPLNGILGNLDELSESKNLEKSDLECVASIQSCGDHLLALINDVLDISKIESGNITLESYPLPIKNLVNGMFKLFDKVANEKGIDLLVEYSEDLPEWVKGDVTRIKQILINLLSNGIKFTKEGSVLLQVSSRGVVRGRTNFGFVVSDTGSGIAKEAHTRIFERFSQADETITRKHGGTGLGLAICKSLCNMMGGDISVASEVGVGSTFSFNILLPQCDPVDLQANSDDSKQAVYFRNLTVLIAEDNLINIKIAKRYLEKLGINPDVVENGQEALDACHLKTYDLVLMDLHMPIMGGLEASRRILAEVPVPPKIVALTAGVFSEDRQACADAGMVEFIEKPLPPKALESVLKKLFTI